MERPSEAVPRCRHARNPHHVCGAGCARAVSKQEALFGGPHAEQGCAYGRWAAPPTTTIAGAAPVVRLEQAAAEVVQSELLEQGEGRPFVLTDAQANWRAHGTWSLQFLRQSFPEDAVLCADKAPFRATDEPPAQTLRVKLQDLVAYCHGEEEAHIARHERLPYAAHGGCPFLAAGWQAFAAHPALATHVAPLPRCLPDVTPARAAEHRAMGQLLLCPPGALMRLHVQEHATHAWLAQMEGTVQVVLYAPSARDLVYGGERLEGHSSFDVFAPDFAAFPRARHAEAHTTILQPGETLVVPAGWWLTWRALAPSLLLQRNWVSRVNLARFVAALQAENGHACDGREDLARQHVAGAAVAVSAVHAEDNPVCDLHERAELYRQRGNSHFAAGQYREATEAYSRAIDLLELPRDGTTDCMAVNQAGADMLAVCLANRAAAWLRRKQWASALADCNHVLRSGRTDAVALKALFRRGKAHEGLGDADAAEADFRRVVEMQPHNADAQQELENYSSILHRIVVLSNGDEDMRRSQQGGL